jgi:hypothetical protein
VLNQPYSGYKRIACDLPCHVAADGTFSGSLLNLSALGAYLVTMLDADGWPARGPDIHLAG